MCEGGSYTLPTLKHKMLNLGSELSGTEIEQSANFKKLVSGEYLSVRPIYGAPEEMSTPCKLLFLTNLPPRFRGGTDAETRRLRIFHFAVKPKVMDVELKSKLRAESAGILKWMIEGLEQILQTKRIPDGGEAARSSLASFSRNHDPVGSFTSEYCLFEPAERAVKSKLFESFAQWCDDAGLCGEKWENFFFKTLHQRHPELMNSRLTIDGKREHCLEGIGLRSDAPNPLDGGCRQRTRLSQSRLAADACVSSVRRGRGVRGRGNVVPDR